MDHVITILTNNTCILMYSWNLNVLLFGDFLNLSCLSIALNWILVLSSNKLKILSSDLRSTKLLIVTFQKKKKLFDCYSQKKIKFVDCYFKYNTLNDNKHGHWTWAELTSKFHVHDVLIIRRDTTRWVVAKHTMAQW